MSELERQEAIVARLERAGDEEERALARLATADRMLAEVSSVRDALELLEAVEAARWLARKRKLNRSVYNHAVVIGMKTERRLAEIIEAGQAAGQIQTPGGDRKSAAAAPINPRTAGNGRAATLEEIGVDSRRLSEHRLLKDRYTEEELERIEEDANAADEDVVRRDLIAPKPWKHPDLTEGDQDYYTPPDVIDAVRATFGGPIDLDPASHPDAQEVVQAARYFTKQDDGLAQQWEGTVFCNPPYGALMRQFLEKIAYHYDAGDVPAAVFLVSLHAVSAQYAGRMFDADLLCITRGRVKFYRTDGREPSAPYGSLFAYWGPDPDRFAEHFWQYGYILQPYRS